MVWYDGRRTSCVVSALKKGGKKGGKEWMDRLVMKGKNGKRPASLFI
jgi:hypothetical protein